MKYLTTYYLELKSLVHFRLNLWTWILTYPLQLLIIYWVWSGIFYHTDNFAGMSFKTILVYYFTVHFITSVSSSIYEINYVIWMDINEGHMDRYLSRPVSYLSSVTSRGLAAPTIELLIATPSFVFSLWFIDYIPILSSAILFVFSLALGILIALEIQKLIGLLTFWFEKVFAIRDILFSFFMLLSGQLIPLAALPGVIGKIGVLSPFSAIYHSPISLLMMEENKTFDYSGLIFLPICWLIVLKLLVSIFWTQGVTKYASQGG